MFWNMYDLYNLNIIHLIDLINIIIQYQLSRYINKLSRYIKKRIYKKFLTFNQLIFLIF